MSLQSQVVPAALWQRVTLAHVPPDDARTLAGQGTDNPARQQDLREFEAFFARFAPQITGYLCRLTGDEQTAFDLCQETFFRAWRHFAGLRGRAEARAWLYRVASHLASHDRRQRARQLQEPLDDELLGASDPAMRVAERASVAHVLQSLTPKQRSALVLYEAQGFSCDEIGAILHMSRDAVKMALYRAREQFRIHYLREEDDA